MGLGRGPSLGTGGIGLAWDLVADLAWNLLVGPSPGLGHGPSLGTGGIGDLVV